MKQLLLSFIEKVCKYRNYFRSLPVRGALIFTICELLKIRKLVETTVNGVKLNIRTNTSDYEVAQSSLVFGEYNTIGAVAPKVIVDGGANIGTSSIAFARKYPEARIIAVEMEAENFEILSKNVKPFTNIIPVKAALASSSRILTIFDRDTGPWGYTITETSNTKHATGQSTVCLTIDMLMNQHNLEKIDILKLDIEGAEKEIFEAGGDWVQKTNIIAVELHDRICGGCERAFYLATHDFSSLKRHGGRKL